MIALAGSAALLAACGGAGVLTSRSATTAQTLSRAQYLMRLGEAQSRLAAAEREIPKQAPTPAALSRAIFLLGGAIHRLARDLGQLAPPPSVSRLHARLVTIVSAYAGSLDHASRDALRPGGELTAARLLLDSTSAVSRQFGATVANIDRQLGQ